MTLQIRQKVAIQPGAAAEEATTRGQLDTAIAEAKNRGTHLGTQTVSTISDFQAEVNLLIAQVIDAAPEALDTLNELAAALGDDPNFSATVNQLITTLSARVTTVENSQASSSAMRSWSEMVGDGAASTASVTHNWALANKNKVLVEVVETATGETVLASITRTNANTITIDFGSYVPSSNQYLVLLQEIA